MSRLPGVFDGGVEEWCTRFHAVWTEATAVGLSVLSPSIEEQLAAEATIRVRVRTNAEC